METITELSPPLLLAFALNAFGYILKQSPIPNWLIPLLLVSLGAIAYPFIAEVGKVSYNVENPNVFNAIIGFCIGGASTGMHQLIRQFSERKNGVGTNPATEKGNEQ